MSVPIYVFAAYSGTGKATYPERLLPFLRARGLGAAVIKHDAHCLPLDDPRPLAAFLAGERSYAADERRTTHDRHLS